mgnify:CR=1 FL=1
MEETFNLKTCEDIRKTVGWIRFYAVLLAIVSILLTILGYNLVSGKSAYIGVNPFVYALFGLSALLLGMAILLFQYSTKINQAQKEQSIEALEEAMRTFKNYSILWGSLSILGAAYSIYEYSLIFA